MTRGAITAVVAAAAACALVGCADPAAGARTSPPTSATGPAPSAGTSTGGEPAPERTTPPEPTTAAEVRDAVGAQPRLAGLSVDVVAEALEVTDTGDGERWSFTPDPDRADRRVALVAAPEGGTFETFTDGSVVVPPAPGAAEGVGIAPPAAGTARLLAPDLLEIRADPAAGVPVELWFGVRAVERATWGEAEGGRSLAVVPTPWARAAGMAGGALTWAYVASFAGDEAGPGLRDQLDCHVVGAPTKASWNLEPWRPDVGPALTMLAACNPT